MVKDKKLHEFLDKSDEAEEKNLETKEALKKDETEKKEQVDVLSKKEEKRELVSVSSVIFDMLDSDTEPLPEVEIRNDVLFINGELVCPIELDTVEKKSKVVKQIEEYCEKHFNGSKRIIFYVVSLVVPDYPLPNSRLEILREIDSKIEHLLDGRTWYVKSYKTDEEAEQDLLQRLINYDLEAWEVIAAMNETPYRWKRRSINEKLEMLNAAYANANVYALASWLNIKPERILIYPGSETFIELILNGEKIKLKGEEILTARRFREQYFALTGILLPPLESKSWCNIINRWCEELGVIDRTRREDISPEQEAAELIIAYIEDSRRVAKKEQAFNTGYFYYDEKSNAIMIPSESIADLLQSRRLKVDLRKVAYALKDYLKSGSKVVKLENGKTRRFWIFDANKFSVDLEHVVDFEADENEFGGE